MENMTNETNSKENHGENKSSPSITGSESAYDKWNEIIQLPSIGPIKAFTKDYNEYCSELLLFTKTLVDLYVSLNGYWIQMSNAYTQALNNLGKKKSSDSEPWDSDQFRIILIDAFEDAFTSLFTSKDFAKAYNEVSSNQIELMNCVHRILEKNLETLRLPTRSELDVILEDINELKRNIRDIRKELESVTNHGRANNSV
jgi:hypothetical protein